MASNDLAISVNLRVVAMQSVIDMIDERKRQDAKWGEQSHSLPWWMLILGEEFGEAQKAILEGDHAGYRAELVQVAAVAIAAIESFDRGFKSGP